MKFNSNTLRRWCRLVHRDLSYLFAGMVLIYAEVKENGSIILNAKILCDILRNLPEDRVSFEADERLSCKIKSGEAEFTLVGTSSA